MADDTSLSKEASYLPHFYNVLGFTGLLEDMNKYKDFAQRFRELRALPREAMTDGQREQLRRDEAYFRGLQNAVDRWYETHFYPLVETFQEQGRISNFGDFYNEHHRLLDLHQKFDEGTLTPDEMEERQNLMTKHDEFMQALFERLKQPSPRTSTPLAEHTAFMEELDRFVQEFGADGFEGNGGGDDALLTTMADQAQEDLVSLAASQSGLDLNTVSPTPTPSDSPQQQRINTINRQYPIAQKAPRKTWQHPPPLPGSSSSSPSSDHASGTASSDHASGMSPGLPAHASVGTSVGTSRASSIHSTPRGSVAASSNSSNASRVGTPSIPSAPSASSSTHSSSSTRGRTSRVETTQERRERLEREIERVEETLFGENLSHGQTTRLQARLTRLEEELARINDTTSHPDDRIRQSVRRRGSQQEVASATTRQDLGQGDHRTTTTTRTTTTVRKGRRPIVERQSNSVSAPLPSSSSSSSSSRGRGKKKGINALIEHLRKTYKRRQRR